MAELMDVRERDGHFEILTQIDSVEGERWEPLATVIVESQLLQSSGRTFDVSIADELLAEGWLSPNDHARLAQNLADLTDQVASLEEAS